MSLRVLATARVSSHLLTEGGKTVPAESLGMLAINISDGKQYRYVKNTDLILDTNNLCTFSDRPKNEVTQDISAGAVGQPAGVYDQVVSIAVGEFFWLQVSGESQVDTEGDSGIAAGDPLIADPALDGEATEVDDSSLATVKAGIGQTFAVASAAEAAGTPDTVKCRLTGLV